MDHAQTPIRTGSLLQAVHVFGGTFTEDNVLQFMEDVLVGVARTPTPPSDLYKLFRGDLKVRTGLDCRGQKCFIHLVSKSIMYGVLYAVHKCLVNSMWCQTM